MNNNDDREFLKFDYDDGWHALVPLYGWWEHDGERYAAVKFQRNSSGNAILELVSPGDYIGYRVTAITADELHNGAAIQ